MNANRGTAFAASIFSGAASILFLRPAAATEDPDVHPLRPAIAVEVDRATLRIDLEKYRLAVGDSIRAALAEAQKSAPREVEVASADVRHGG